MELAVVIIDDLHPKVHELWRSTDVELHAFEAAFDSVALEPQQALHTLGVYGARPHPLVDGDLGHRFQATG